MRLHPKNSFTTLVWPRDEDGGLDPIEANVSDIPFRGQ